MNLNNPLRKLKNLVSNKIWLVELDQLKGIKLLMVRFLRTIIIVVNDFFRDKCVLRASALAFTTLLALVPLAAVGFSLLKAFGVQQEVQNWILKTLTANLEDVAREINNAIANINATSLPIANLCVLIVTSVLLIGNMEKSFNEIWYIRKGRPILRKFSDYLCVLIFGPLLVAAAITLTTSFKSSAFFEKIMDVPPFYQFIIYMSPFLSIWIGMIFLYMFMPNTKVRLGPAIIGGIISGTLWVLAKNFYLLYQTKVLKANIVYGGLVQLPLLLIWLYISWAVTLLGAEITFAIQNLGSYSTERRRKQLSQSFKETLALRMIIAIGRSFYKRGRAWDVARFSSEWRVPYDIIAETVDLLCRTKILVEIQDKNASTLVPAQPFEELSIADVLKTIRRYGDTLSLMKPDDSEEVIDALAPTIEHETYGKLETMKIKDILFKEPLEEPKPQVEHLKIEPDEES
jgi:membrane protein